MGWRERVVLKEIYTGIYSILLLTRCIVCREKCAMIISRELLFPNRTMNY